MAKIFIPTSRLILKEIIFEDEEGMFFNNS